MKILLVFVAVATFVISVGGSDADAQAGRATGQSTNWPTYGSNLASHRYSPADQITKDNFSKLEIAWRLKTDFLGPRPDTLYSATSLLVDRVLYTTAGMRRAVIALNPATGEMLSDMSCVAGQARGAGPGRGGGATVQGLPLLKPPYDRITAYNMNTGETVWQKTHSSTPDSIRNHPAGRTFIGVLTTKNLVVAGDGGVHTNAAGRRVALLRAYDKLTGEDAGAVEMPNRQTGSPMSYQIDGKQLIVLAVSGNDGAELLAVALP